MFVVFQGAIANIQKQNRAVGDLVIFSSYLMILNCHEKTESSVVINKSVVYTIVSNTRTYICVRV